VATRPSNHPPSDDGFNVVELLVGLAIVGILTAIAIPSLSSFYKPLSIAVSSTTSQLTLIRSKAMASSRAYRIRPRFTTAAEYVNSKPNQFIVEYNKNGGSCNTEESTTTAGVTIWNWAPASQLDFQLSDKVVLDNYVVLGGATQSNYLDWDAGTTLDPRKGFCFDSRGMPRTFGGIISTITFRIKDELGNNVAKSANISINGTGGVSYTTYSSSNGTGPLGQKF
jgi:prepilin-type N-terminal cleavage/methylation domain-containing protein